jgi:nucleoside-diphosphate-sugar epimerase
MRIAVLGASGVAGRAFVAAAGAAGHTLATQRVDVFDPAALVKLFEGCEAVVNLANSIPQPGGRGDWAVNDRIRREGTTHVLAACRESSVRLLVQQSVAMLHCADDTRLQTENDPLVGYGVFASAADMEAIVRSSPLDVRVVRGGLFYGPDTGSEQRWLDNTRERAFRVPGDGKAWLSPVHVQDFAAALLAVLDRGDACRSYIASDDQPLQLDQLYAKAAAQAGVNPPATGGPQPLRSFRVSNARLRALGWRPAHSALGVIEACG